MYMVLKDKQGFIFSNVSSSFFLPKYRMTQKLLIRKEELQDDSVSYWVTNRETR